MCVYESVQQKKKKKKKKKSGGGEGRGVGGGGGGERAGAHQSRRQRDCPPFEASFGGFFFRVQVAVRRGNTASRLPSAIGFGVEGIGV